MDVNATLIAQMVTFAIFVAFTMKFVWPPISRALEKRREQIASGLAAAEQGQKELELAHHKSKQQLTEAKAQASTIIEQAHHRANRIIEEAKSQARIEGDRLLSLAQTNIAQEYQSAKDELIKEISGLAIAGAEKIIRHHVDKTENERLIAELMDEI